MNNLIDFSIKRGKVYIGNCYNFDTVDADLYIYCASCESNSPEGTLLLEDIAPSYELLVQIYSWIKTGILESKKDAIEKLYLDELNNREDCQLALSRLKDFITKGKKIVLFDNPYANCDFSHLYILQRYLSEIGIRVKYIKDVSHYQSYKKG